MTEQVTLYAGDYLEVLRNMSAQSVDLIYHDPPFLTQRFTACLTENGTRHILFRFMGVTL